MTHIASNALLTTNVLNVMVKLSLTLKLENAKKTAQMIITEMMMTIVNHATQDVHANIRKIVNANGQKSYKEMTVLMTAMMDGSTLTENASNVKLNIVINVNQKT